MPSLQGVAGSISKYLRSLDVVNAYVITTDGLPLLFHGVSEAEGEELGGVGEGLLKSSLLRRVVRDADTLVITGSRDVVIHRVNDSTYVTALVDKDSGYSLASSISANAPRCGKCGGSLRYAIVTCPRCGRRLPFTSVQCTACGEVIRFRRCPNCSAVIDCTGRPAGIIERLGAGAIADSSAVAGQRNGGGQRTQ